MSSSEQVRREQMFEEYYKEFFDALTNVIPELSAGGPVPRVIWDALAQAFADASGLEVVIVLRRLIEFAPKRTPLKVEGKLECSTIRTYESDTAAQ